VPIAAVVRDAVDRTLPIDPGDREALIQRALAAVGGFHSGTGDLSERHDEILGEGDW